MTKKSSGLDTAAKSAAYSTNVQEAANLGDWVYARTHIDMVMRVDDMLAGDRLTADEYKATLEAVEMAMATFRGVLSSNAPQVFARGPWEDATPPPADSPAPQMTAEERGNLGGNGESFLGEPVELLETVVRKDGSIPVKVIQPGWGTSGYYPAEVLERDGPKVFTKGLHMYWDHPTEREEMERPERALDDLAAVLMGDARWQENGPKGPGLYADALVVDHYRQKVDSLAPHIGVSIRAFGTATQGEAEGRQGPVIEALTAGQSIDFVTIAGAGGEIVNLFESARKRAVSPATSGDVSIQNPVEEVANMDDLQRLQEANAALQRQLDEAKSLAARSQEALMLREAREVIQVTLGKTDLPAITRTRLAESMARDVPVKEGGLDKAALESQIAEAVKAEVKYLAEAAGLGRIRGMGGSDDADTEADEGEGSESDLVEAFQALGLSENGAKIAAAGRK